MPTSWGAIMGLNSLLQKLESRDAVTSVTPAEKQGVTPKAAPAKACTPVTPVTPQIERNELLAQFRLDLCANDPEPEAIARVNNIAYSLITVNGWKFPEAMTAAAVWVANNPMHADEHLFIDVMALWRELGAK
jgi:hypothetical protein